MSPPWRVPCTTLPNILAPPLLLTGSLSFHQLLPATHPDDIFSLSPFSCVFSNHSKPCCSVNETMCAEELDDELTFFAIFSRTNCFWRELLVHFCPWLGACQFLLSWSGTVPEKLQIPQIPCDVDVYSGLETGHAQLLIALRRGEATTMAFVVLVQDIFTLLLKNCKEPFSLMLTKRGQPCFTLQISDRNETTISTFSKSGGLLMSQNFGAFGVSRRCFDEVRFWGFWTVFKCNAVVEVQSSHNVTFSIIGILGDARIKMDYDVDNRWEKLLKH